MTKRPDVSEVFPQHEEDRYFDWPALLGIILTAVGIIGMILFLGYADHALGLRQVWNDSCTDRGGIVVTQYRSDDWCVKDGIIIDSGSGN